eukprot:3723012-Rhodomonas_salina.2
MRSTIRYVRTAHARSSIRYLSTAHHIPPYAVSVLHMACGLVGAYPISVPHLSSSIRYLSTAHHIPP